MLLACIALFACGVAIARLGVRWPALAVTSGAVGSVYAGCAGLTEGLSWLIVPEAYVLLTALQGGYLLCLTRSGRCEPVWAEGSCSWSSFRSSR